MIYEIVSPIVDSYYEHYPGGKEKVYPYAEISFPKVKANNEYSSLNELYIDIWDNKSEKIEEIENITDKLVQAIMNGLNTRIIKTDNMFIQINKDKTYRLDLTDTDANIIYKDTTNRLELQDIDEITQRRELRFLIKVYERKDIK
ncbi:hypothetical protein BJV85_000102 [Clostridium acetobutylicum]|uniref:hypothetical protein n=1 Tax=Clostridium TaxID=1485 RepID=UPI000200A75E|nr:MULTISPECIES: hypothetical protein [Clostridium]ADZ19098.1 Conserved hypothetical protein [Clostridium acetobutylicum EA 2018]NOV87131.1 hypothetical protein [Clostridium acetobutylicum]NOW14523.1 hypothetical protein [Clostridium acetobutylicum]NRY58538.1 hypothetical protein [Clostridium acetobutylicum]NSA91256.1 hypothetical protein [Clostridium acetobutylicum]